LLQHDPTVLSLASIKPLVLHCASLSIAGTLSPSQQTVNTIAQWIHRTKTPWLGEHLSFVTAEREIAGPQADPYAPGEPYNIGYTVSPPMNSQSVDHVVAAVEHWRREFGIPLLLENAPVYFSAPGTTMTQVAFVQAICEACPVLLLLDLSHFFITSQTLRMDVKEALLAYPLDRVVELHVSGVEMQEGALWDNHATPAPDIIFELLSLASRGPRVQAVTLEYNWSSRFPPDVLLSELLRTRDAVGAPSSEGAHE